MIKDQNIKAGAVLNPATDITSVQWVLDELDFVLIMSVNPGFGGQRFISSSLEKINTLRKLIDTHQRSILIQVDGGVNLQTIADIAAAGADVLVAGSAVFGSDDYVRTIASLKSKANEAVK
jgi:ribulose-phosphate 3-epimerase